MFSELDRVHAVHAGVSDCAADIDGLVADGPDATLRYTARGRLTAELFGMPPTGEPITMTGIEWYQLRDGLITDYWAHSSTELG